MKASREGSKPRCPECQSEDLSLGIVQNYIRVLCRNCPRTFRVDKVEHLAQFFPIAAILEENQRLAKELEEAQRARKHTQDWYAAHYGKLHDWARKRLPENFQNEFFGCLANGLWHYADDVGEPYRCADGSTITPGGYFQMETAQEQILHDQSDRAEAAELKLRRMREALETIANWPFDIRGDCVKDAKNLAEAALAE